MRFNSESAKAANRAALFKRWGFNGGTPLTPSQRNKRHYAKHRSRIRAYRDKWLKSHGRRYNREYQRKLRRTRLQYLLRNRLSSRLCHVLKKNRKSDKTEALLGCSIERFREYFQSLFLPGMSWQHVLSGEIHIDHKKPCRAFDLSKPEQQRACFHFSNLQPLWAFDNLSKKDKIIT